MEPQRERKWTEKGGKGPQVEMWPRAPATLRRHCYRSRLPEANDIMLKRLIVQVSVLRVEVKPNDMVAAAEDGLLSAVSLNPSYLHRPSFPPIISVFA